MSAPAADAARPLAIICGGGSLPIAVAKAVSGRGRGVVLFPITGTVSPEAVAGYPHAFIALGQLGRLTRLARKFGCRDMVMIGTVLRPALRQIRLDWATLRELPRIVAMFRGGDDHLLTMLGRIFEDQGFRLLGAHEVAPEILVPAGPLGRRVPSERDRADIARGLAALTAMGPFDIGQGVVVADGHVLAVEAAEGTDGMVERVAALRGAGRIPLPAGRGVLVKAPKPGQDRRFDLPSIGPRTVESARRAGLAGIAVAAGATIIAEPQAVAAAADAAGLFVQGVASEAAKPPESA
jgi:UDP-2,3-diacylglucosamine hydrolase